MGKVLKGAGNVLTAKTRFPPSRKPRVLNKRAEALHALHVGYVVHAWNCAHAELFNLFRIVVGKGDHGLGPGIWHTIMSDKTQRDMLEAAVIGSKSIPHFQRKGILWAISALNNLAVFRNDAAHTEMLFYYDLTMPGSSVKKSSLARLSERPFEKHWKQVRGDLHGIANYLALLALSLELGFPRPSSRRPPLLFARSIDASSQAKRRRAKKAARERQRQSSRP